MAERLRKEDLYRILLAASIELCTTGDAAPFVVESQRAWLYASDAVLKEINVYLKAFSAYAEAEQLEADTAGLWAGVQDAEGRLRLCIRKDLRPKTKITSQWVKGEWEMVTSRPERIRRYLDRESASSQEDETV